MSEETCARANLDERLATSTTDLTVSSYRGSAAMSVKCRDTQELSKNQDRYYLHFTIRTTTPIHILEALKTRDDLRPVGKRLNVDPVVGFETVEQKQ